MNGLRQHLSHHRALVAVFLTLALLIKILVPGGYMLGTTLGSISLELCSGSGPQAMVVALPAGHPSDGRGDVSKAEMPCAFAGLSAPSLAAADPVLLTAALAFIFVAALWPVRLTAAPGAPDFLRPQLRGPPVRS